MTSKRSQTVRFPLVAMAMALALLLSWATAEAATRPQYGGVLRIELRATPNTYVPPILSSTQVVDEDITALIFDRLCRLDAMGRPAPQLARSWEHDVDFRHWQLHLQPRVHMHSGGGLSPAAVAAVLGAQHPEWRIRAGGDGIAIEADIPQPDLLYELARPRNAIALPKSDGTAQASGPFRVVEWAPGKHLTLRAFDEYWGGRPYVDGIEITLGRSATEQIADLNAGKADVIDADFSSDEIAQLTRSGHRLSQSSPLQLVALRFAMDVPLTSQFVVRQGIAIPLNPAAIARTTMPDAAPATGLLPLWMRSELSTHLPTPVTALVMDPALAPANSLAPTPEQLRQARLALQKYLQQAAALRPPNATPQGLKFTLGYDGHDTRLRAVAESVAASITAFTPAFTAATSRSSSSGIQVELAPDMGGPPTEVTASLVLIRLDSTHAHEALAGLLPLADPQQEAITQKAWLAAPPASLDQTARQVARQYWIVPIAHLPLVRVISPRVANWLENHAATWRVDDLWLRTGRDETLPRTLTTSPANVSKPSPK